VRECFGLNKIIKRVKQSGIASGIVPDRKKSCKLPRLLTLELILYGGYAVGITNDVNLLRDGQRDLLGFGNDSQLGVVSFIFLVSNERSNGVKSGNFDLVFNALQAKLL